MEYVVYQNTNEPTQIFVGVVLISALVANIGLVIYFWISDKIKNRK